MLSTELLAKFKQVNVSADTEKTADRIRQIWQNADRDGRDAILSRIDVALVTIQRAYKSGKAHPRIIVALAEYGNVSPSYVNGSTDEAGEFNDDTLIAFLEEINNSDLIPLVNEAGKKPAKKPRKKKEVVAVEDPAEEVVADEPVAEPAPAAVPEEVCCCEHAHVEEEPEDEEETEYIYELEFSEEAVEAAKTVPDDEAEVLFKALLLKAKAGVSKDLRDAIVTALLS
ncbi:hypothetical protein FACS189490_00180 [Clostridia bacterium]|nr:hypothetical protein FACS189490_00180 [Clostridia bacterium]